MYGGGDLQIVFLGVGYRCYYSFHPGDYKGFAVFEMAAVVAVEGEAWKEFGYNRTYCSFQSGSSTNSSSDASSGR